MALSYQELGKYARIGALVAGGLVSSLYTPSLETRLYAGGPAESEKNKPKEDKNKKTSEKKNPSADKKKEEPAVNLEEKLLAEINSYRNAVGVDAVTFDEKASEHCTAHARYLVMNMNDASQGLSGHNEDPALPGYTEEGAKIAKQSIIGLGGPAGHPELAVKLHMATPLHRLPLLTWEVDNIGIGYAKLDDTLASVISFHYRVMMNKAKMNKDPVIFPYPNQKDVPLAYAGGERPDPISEDNDKKAGFPITVTWYGGNPPRNLTAQLKNLKTGKLVDSWISTPDYPLVKNDWANLGVYVMAKDPLLPRTGYEVTLSGVHKELLWEKKWQFTTGGISAISQATIR
ncbi:MAG: CAP domain-containing protein [Nanoarchaeota archaeon]